jgi:AraC-like DNA-binding protein
MLPKTYYHQQVINITQKYFGKEYLYAHIKQAKLYIDAHYADNMNIDAIAAKAFFSKFHFIRLFNNLYGQTPYQYLTSVRIAKAKQFLLSGKPVAETCLLVGFTSPTSFAGLFRKYTRCSPLAFIKNNALKTTT